MLDRTKKSIQISWIAAILFSTTIWNSYSVKALESSQVLGGNLSWQCGISPAIKSTIRSNGATDRALPCESPQERAVRQMATADPAAVNQLIQQGIQLLETAQPLLIQFLQPLGPSAPQPTD